MCFVEGRRASVKSADVPAGMVRMTLYNSKATIDDASCDRFHGGRIRSYFGPSATFDAMHQLRKRAVLPRWFWSESAFQDLIRRTRWSSCRLRTLWLPTTAPIRGTEPCFYTTFRSLGLPWSGHRRGADATSYGNRQSRRRDLDELGCLAYKRIGDSLLRTHGRNAVDTARLMWIDL